MAAAFRDSYYTSYAPNLKTWVLMQGGLTQTSELSGVAGKMVTVSVVIPARNEAANIERCLRSVCSQDGGGVCELVEVVVVDDGSTDCTPLVVERLRREFPLIVPVRAGPVPQGWTGKNWALWCGVARARGQWLLLLDADTELYAGALKRAVALAIEHGCDLVSFSPEQVAEGFWERAVQPVVFDLLEAVYDYGRINDPASDEAACNGQFLLIRRTVYDAVGGHRSVKGAVVEDVALARLVKSRGGRLHFSCGRRVVRCHMYGSLPDLIQGWSKNLYTLLLAEGRARRRTLGRLAIRVFLPLASLAILCAVVLLSAGPAAAAAAVAAAAAAGFVMPLRRGCAETAPRPLLYVVGFVVVVLILALSAYRTRRGRVVWKGRTYRTGEENLSAGDGP